MPIELTKPFAPQDYAEALESWAWVGLERKTPIVSSLFGDVIFEAGDGYWFLDTVAGKLERAWPDKRSLDAELATPAGKSTTFSVTWRWLRTRQGCGWARTRSFDFNLPPVLGGGLDATNLCP